MAEMTVEFGAKRAWWVIPALWLIEFGYGISPNLAERAARLTVTHGVKTYVG